MTKGQSTIEFTATAILFILALTGIIFSITDKASQFENSLQESSKNMEIYTLTQQLLYSPGLDTNQNTEWEKNPEKTVKTGLAKKDYILQKDKITQLSTTGDKKLNYSRFQQIEDLNHQYNFKFVWLPIIETSKNFTKGNPPSKITPPSDQSYSNADSRVHFGEIQVAGDMYRFLVTSHSNQYDTARYTKNDWDFNGDNPKNVQDNINMNNTEFTIKKFQNRNQKTGTLLILNNTIKEFGSNPNQKQTEVTKLNRYAALNASDTSLEPVRIEVLAW